MKNQLLWAALAIVVTTSIPSASISPVYSAIPPLSEQNLKSLSHYIVIGIVMSDQSKEIPANYGTIHAHTATIQVESIEKTRSRQTPLKPGQTIEVRYERRGKTGGRTGSQRQSKPLEIGMKVKLFLVEGKQGFFLLEPNGWQPYLPQAKTPATQSRLDEQLKRAGWNPAVTRAFIHQIRLAAEQADAKAFANLVRFPVTISQKVYHEPESLIRDFPQVFTEDVLQELKQVDDSMISVQQKHVMIGGGTIWFDQEESSPKIVSIANWITFQRILEYEFTKLRR